MIAIEIDGNFYNCSEIKMDANKNVVVRLQYQSHIYNLLRKWMYDEHVGFVKKYKKDITVISGDNDWLLISSILTNISTDIYNGELSFELVFDYFTNADKGTMVRMLREKKLKRLKELNF